MRLKKQLKKAKLPLHQLLLNPKIRKFWEKIPILKGTLPMRHRSHPFDAVYGIDTSGFLPVDLIHKDPELRALINPYGGAHPSVTRAALSSLPNISAHRFADLGCGKGRVVILASEFPFEEISGVELSSGLVKIAQANVKNVSEKNPFRPAMRIIEGNVLDHFQAEGKAVFYLYHPFGREITAQLAMKIEAALAAELEHVFIVYHNPVWGEVFDASPALTRWSAGTVVLDAAETNTTGETHDNFVVWQSLRNAYGNVRPGANRPIIFQDSQRAELG